MFLRPLSIVRQEQNVMLPPAAVSCLSILWFFPASTWNVPIWLLTSYWLQATTALDRAIKMKGLEDVQTSLKPNISGLKHLRPIIKRKMIVLFVVPDSLRVRVTFAKRTIKSAKQKEKEPLWYRRTSQSTSLRYKKRCSKQHSHDTSNNDCNL